MQKRRQKGLQFQTLHIYVLFSNDMAVKGLIQNTVRCRGSNAAYCSLFDACPRAVQSHVTCDQSIGALTKEQVFCIIPFLNLAVLKNKNKSTLKGANQLSKNVTQT